MMSSASPSSGPLLALCPDLLKRVLLNTCDSARDLHAVLSSARDLRTFGETEYGQHLIRTALVQTGRNFKAPDDDRLRELAICDARTVLHPELTFAHCLTTATHQSALYQPLMTSDLDEDVEPLGDDAMKVFFCDAQICFGLIVHLDELKEKLYLGRRWYNDRHSGEIPKSRDGSFEMVSQPLSEEPYDEEDCYTEIHEMGDLEEFWMSPSDGDTRPPGVKSWRGPLLCADRALKDLFRRTGFDPELFTLTGSGWSDGGSDFAVLGIRLGRSLPSAGFDIHHASMDIEAPGMHYRFTDYDDVINSIEPVGLDYVAALIGLSPDAAKQRQLMDEGFRERVASLLECLGQGNVKRCKYYVAFHD